MALRACGVQRAVSAELPRLLSLGGPRLGVVAAAGAAEAVAGSDSWISSLYPPPAPSCDADVAEAFLRIVEAVPVRVPILNRKGPTPAPTRPPPPRPQKKAVKIDRAVDMKTLKELNRIWIPHARTLKSETSMKSPLLTKRVSQKLFAAFEKAQREGAAGPESLTSVIRFLLAVKRARLAYTLLTDVKGGLTAGMEWSPDLYACLVAVLSALGHHNELHLTYRRRITYRPRIVSVAYLQAVVTAAPSRASLAALEPEYCADHLTGCDKVVPEGAVLDLLLHVLERNAFLKSDAVAHLSCLAACTSRSGCERLLLRMDSLGMLGPPKPRAAAPRAKAARRKRGECDPAVLLEMLLKRAHRFRDLAWAEELGSVGVRVGGVVLLPPQGAAFEVQRSLMLSLGDAGKFAEVLSLFKRLRGEPFLPWQHDSLSGVFIRACERDGGEEAYHLAVACFLGCALVSSTELHHLMSNMAAMCVERGDTSTLTQVLQHGANCGVDCSNNPRLTETMRRLYKQQGVPVPSVLASYSVWGMCTDAA